MSDTVIKAEGLGKKYLIGHQSERERYTALRDVMARNVKDLWNKTRQVLSGQQLLAGDEIEEFWALRDIDFEIKRGDRVGIIGRNGAGKSTLLKVLSRITEPSEGKVTIKGRVASLLEVGTGFHPELTGRENIYLNGAILGMTRNEIKKKFDEIVDFAGVEKFLDTPVKRYSSGMYVRLAFAVAAHLEPEILVVDEVLAVGDAEFQKKCLGKMEDVSKNEGRTVLFVSHNIEAIKNLCTNGIVLNAGCSVFQGSAQSAVLKYTQMNFKRIKNINLIDRLDRIGIGKIRVQEVWFEDEKGNELSVIETGELLKIKIKVQKLNFTGDVYCSIVIKTIDGMRVWTLSSEMKDQKISLTGNNTFIFQIDKMPLIEKIYLCDIRIAEKNDDLIQDWIKEAFTLEVIGNDFFKSGQPQASDLDVFYNEFTIYAENS